MFSVKWSCSLTEKEKGIYGSNYTSPAEVKKPASHNVWTWTTYLQSS